MPTLELTRSTLAYTDVGEGPAVVLVHGSASSRRQWRGLSTQLAERFRVLAPDLHGYGQTTIRPATRLRLSDELALVYALAEQVSGPIHLVGHSYGGALALMAADRLRGRLASLTLIEPAAFQLLRIADDVDAWCEIDDIAQRHIGLAWERKFEACADLFMRYWIGARAWGAMAPEKRAVVVAAMPKVAMEWLWTAQIEPGADAWRDLHVPTLLLRGTQTRFAASRVVDLLHESLPARVLVEIEGAGHMSPVTHAAPVNAAIEAHLECHSVGLREAFAAPVPT